MKADSKTDVYEFFRFPCRCGCSVLTGCVGYACLTEGSLAHSER